MNDKFFPELARRLRAHGIAVGEADGALPVLVDGRTAMQIEPSGTILLDSNTKDDPAVTRTYDTVTRIATKIREYTAAMAAAPPLVADGLHDGFRLLAEFNGVVLAGQELDRNWGYQFVTWRRDGIGTGVCNGNYYMNDYAGAKLDFACRSGLVDGHRQFSDEQLIEMYRCIHETLDSEYPFTEERWNVLASAAERIEHAVDDLEERVNQSNQQELEAADDTGPSWEMSP